MLHSLNRTIKMSNIWNGEVGMTKHWCPYCDFLWDDEFKDEYVEHMNGHGGSRQSGEIRVTGVDKETATVTFTYAKQSGEDHEAKD